MSSPSGYTICRQQSSAWAEITRSERFNVPGLDALRTASVAIVVASHAITAFRVPGDVGVTVFFFISGFLITSLLLREVNATKTVDIRSFYVRRYFRLMPELAAYVLVCLVVIFSVNQTPKFLDVFGSLFYFYNYVKAISGDTHYIVGTFEHLWSLSVEEHFYLAFPLVVFALKNRTNILLLVLLIVIAISPLWRSFYVESSNPHAIYYVSDCRFDSIAYGCVAAVLFGQGYAGLLWERLGSWAYCALPVALALVALSFKMPVVPEAMFKFSTQGLALFVLFFAIYGAPAGNWMLKAIDASPLSPLGKYTYGIYLWHPLLITIAHACLSERLASRLSESVLWQSVFTASVFAAALALAILSYRYVLAPFGSIRRRFGSH